MYCRVSRTKRTFLRRTVWLLLAPCLLLDGPVGWQMITYGWCDPPDVFGDIPVTRTAGVWTVVLGFVLFQGGLVVLGLRLREPPTVIHI